MTLQTVFKMVFFPFCVTLYMSLNVLAEPTPIPTPSAVASTPTMESASSDSLPLQEPPIIDKEGDVEKLPELIDNTSDKISTPDTPMENLAVETPVATPQTTTAATIQQTETLEESIQKIGVMGKVLNALGPEVDETLRNAALNVAEADKTNDKELYQKAVQIFEALYEKHFGKTESHTSVQGLAESLKKVEVMSKVVEAIGPKGNIELREAAQQVFAADNAGDEAAYQQAVENFELLYQAAEAKKAENQ